MKELIGVSCFLLMGLSWQVGAYDERDLQELLETKDCEMCDLTSVDLSGKDLSGSNLAGADLTKANLNAANLNAAKLNAANLTGADLTEANLNAANLNAANLTGADLTEANLTKANLHAADLTAANLKDAKGFNTSENADWYPYVGVCLTIMPDGSANNSVCERMVKHEREWRILAEEGYAYAQARLGKLYKNGDGVPQDDKAALKWFTLAVEQGNAEGQYGLGSMYWYGEGVPRDHKAALKWFTLAVEQGNAKAMDRLGFMYAGGVGVPQNYVYAHMWWNIAVSIYRDYGREIDIEYASKDRDQIAKRMTSAEIEKAEKLASECIAKKYKGCQSTAIESATVATESPSGADYDKGLAAYQSGDFATALREWRPLAEQGDAGAQSNLGLMYNQGQGVPQNDKTAVKWYTLAAEQGIAQAQFNLGQMYDQGQGVPQNDKTAVKWFTLAAEQGIADAQNNLGVMYHKGQGVPQDNVYAHMWWQIAAASGNMDAVKNIYTVAKQITLAEISEAEKLALECVRKKYKGC